MSKYELRSQTASLSGVAYEESQKWTTLSPPLLTRIGLKNGVHTLASLFYDRVFQDKENPWFLGIFASSTKSEAIDNQFRFLVETFSFGGEELYKAKKGKYTRLVGRHANYKITTDAAERWLVHMNGAIDEHEELKKDEEAKEYLYKYFRFMDFYIVVASEYMKDDQLSGGTQIDSGRVW